MRDISRKIVTQRSAIAWAELFCSPATIQRIHAHQIPKGDPLEVSKVAAIQAAKQTPQILPYCHSVGLDFVGVEFRLGTDRIEVEVTVKAIDQTGVEMEALTAASVAVLNLYDMLKMLDDTMAIGGVKLLAKRGGKSDRRSGFAQGLRAAVVVISDSVAAGEKEDMSGRLICERLQEEGLELADYRVVSDDPEEIDGCLRHYADQARVNLVLTTGGTGFGPRDNTPEVMGRLIEREAAGIVEAARAYGQARTPHSMLSRGRAGIRGNTLIVNLPGSRGGVAESLDALLPGMLHAFKMLRGEGHDEEHPRDGRRGSADS
ncbi:MAG: bifunctional molybdenum cofactor biosynthesis protein MoaC/MoaB [Verrucomicrobiota bacterium]|jgi:cyclic pyranopterin phosphate synthase